MLYRRCPTPLAPITMAVVALLFASAPEIQAQLLDADLEHRLLDDAVPGD